MNSSLAKIILEFRNLVICNVACLLAVMVAQRRASVVADFVGRGTPFRSAWCCGVSGWNLAASCAALSC